MQDTLIIQPVDYYISKKKIYSKNNIYYRISNIVDKFDPEKFADWMRKGFAASNIKTQAELTKAVKSNPATISRLMSGAPQSINNKASQPPRELVIKLAEVFGVDIDEGLLSAGHAPIQSDAIPPEIKILFHGAEGWSEQRWNAITEAIKKDIDLIKSIIPE